MDITGVDAAMAQIGFRRSSFCGESGCVEVGSWDARMLVRDSKLDDSPVLSFTREEWTAFVAGVKNGEFD